DASLIRLISTPAADPKLQLAQESFSGGKLPPPRKAFFQSALSLAPSVLPVFALRRMMMDVLRAIGLAVSALSLPAAAVQCQAGSADLSYCAFPAETNCFPGINTGMTATPSFSGECITPSPSNKCAQSVAAGSKAGNPSNGGKALVAGTCTAFCSSVMGTARYCGTGPTYASTGSVNCQGCAATTITTTTTPMSGSCPSDCSLPMCQAGNPSNGGKALVAGACTAFCSSVMGTARYCGTGPTYASTGSVNCQGCAAALAQISAETHEDASMLQVKVKASQAVVDDLNETFSKSLTQDVQCQAGSGNAAYCGFNVPASGHYPNQNTCWAGINTGATATGSCTTPSKNNACWLQVATTYYPQSLAWVWATPYLTCCNCWQRKDWTPSLLQGETQELPSDEDEVAHIQTFAHKTDL
ncbi:unnamed protein product, partial [Polarella glacialis]